MVTKGKTLGVRMDWEVGIGIYTLLYTKLTGSKDLLYSLGKSIQYSVIAYMERKSVKKNGYVWVCRVDLLCCTPEANTTL